jgi:hypothetical protein
MSAVPDPPGRRDWRETVRIATDLALLGILVALASLPLVTAGAAVATGSAAIEHYLAYDRWPGRGFCLAVFRRRLLPGLLISLAVLVAVALLVADLLALHVGAVPGGLPVLVLTLAVAALAAGWAGLALVAARDITLGRVAAAAGVLAVAVLLAIFVHPALTPVLAGYTLFALHVVARRPAAAPALLR